MKTPKLKSYIVESIEYDFSEFGDGDPQFQLSNREQKDIQDNTLGIWYAYDDEHLIDKISDTMGWVIKSIEYDNNRPSKLTSYM